MYYFISSHGKYLTKHSRALEQEKSTRLLPKTLSDTLKRLRETPGKEARKQVQVILAAASHHR